VPTKLRVYPEDFILCNSTTVLVNVIENSHHVKIMVNYARLTDMLRKDQHRFRAGSERDQAHYWNGRNPFDKTFGVI
jgi:hypothetical protein